MKIINKQIKQGLALMCLGALSLSSASSYAARCEYLVQSEWNSGFVANIRITNDTSTTINGWSVSWAYSDGTQRTGGWNAQVSGNNPFTATGVGWNNTIYPGQYIEFGVQGNKGVMNAPAARPTVTGAVCGAGVSSSVRSSVVPSSIAPSSVAPSSIAPSSIAPSSSAQPSSTPLPSSSLQPSSRSSSSLISSSSPSSRAQNTAPIADLSISVQGATVFFDARASHDAEGDTLSYSLSYGDGGSIAYDHAWHSFTEAKTYIAVLKVSDGQATTSLEKAFTISSLNFAQHAPIAMLTTVRSQYAISARASASFDEDFDPLSYTWNFGDGEFSGNSAAGVADCAPGETGLKTRLVTLTVSDGELGDTVQRNAGGLCGTTYDVVPVAKFSYSLDGLAIRVDARETTNTTGLAWDFGDGSAANGLIATHVYANPGVYKVTLSASGPTLFGGSQVQEVVVGTIASSIPASSVPGSSSLSSSSLPAPSSMSASSSSLYCPQGNSWPDCPASTWSDAYCQAHSNICQRSSASLSSVAPSSVMLSSSLRSSQASSAQSSDRNLYVAHKAATAPVIDGVADAVWNSASWAPIDVFWLGTQPNPSAQDYTGRYKALWDEDYLYLLFDITDDRLFDGYRNALDRYWEDDTVELFIDENKSGGQHGYNTSAWAYHVSTYGDVVDSTTSSAKLLNDHIDVRLVSNGSKHLWEMRVRIYGEDYADWKTNTPLKLFAGKLMGFSACYIDNDGSPQRESMMGSVDTQGHKNNQGYLDASVFGSMLLTN